LRQVVYPSLAASKYLRRRRRAQPRTLAVLTYHGVLPPSYQTHDSFFDDAMIQADAFRRQLRFLKANYSVITPEDCQHWLQGRIGLPDAAVLLTCDDGLLNNLTSMVPVLREENFRCLFFLTGYSLSERPDIPWYFQLYFFLMLAPAELAGLELDSKAVVLSLRSRGEREGTWWRLMRELSTHDPETREAFLEHLRAAVGLREDWDCTYRADSGWRERYLPLSASNLAQLLDSGMTIGGHTLSHPVLARTSAELARKEIMEGRRALEQAVGKPVWAFAYPFGDAGSVTEREFEFAQEAGYDCAFLNFGGCASDDSRDRRFALPRLHVSANMRLSELEALVSGFDWSLRQYFGA
jgi:peptidoglycan/xylan/chitin deacetylase (PgdA/CDA1 family)